MTSVIQAIASAVQARENCAKSGNAEWYQKHMERAEELVKEHLPSGSGFDGGTKLIWVRSRVDKIVFATSFHHMNENGYYDGWTDHQVVVTPTFRDFDVRVTGQDRNGIKEFIAEQFNFTLSGEVENNG